MGFHAYSSPYDWSRIAPYKTKAAQVPGGIVDLSVGSPVDPVPQSVREALAAASDAKNAHGYPVTAGSGDLRDAIFEWFRAVRGVDLQSINADVVPTVGSKEAVALMASLLHLGEGDVVVQPKVSYPTYEIGTQLAGASVLKVDDVSDVDSWCHVPGVKAVWVNSPCNPTGGVLSGGWLSDIVAAIKNYDFGHEVEIIAASVRSANHVTQAALMGADIATVPYAAMKKCIKHPLTDQGLEKFKADWEKVVSA